MAGNFKKEDLRILKTRKFLNESLGELLKTKKFKAITVNDLCEYAMISRAAFYSHYKDKYDLLEAWLISKIDYSTDRRKALLEKIIYDNNRLAVNLINDLDDETHNILSRFLVRFLLYEDGTNDPDDPEYLIFINFYTGGMLRLLSCQFDNKYPDLLGSAQKYFFEFIDNIKNFHKKNSKIKEQISERKKS